MKEKTCCFTGHRMIDEADINAISQKVEVQMEQLMLLGVRQFCAGGALGFDTLCAKNVLKIKKKVPDITFTLVLPCKTQAQGWSKANQVEYQRMMNCADRILFTSEQYYPGCMHVRNRKLVELSAYCISYLRTNTGGTFYTVNYAKQQGLVVIDI